MNSTVFITNKFLGEHGFNILIQRFFQKKPEQIYQFSLKSKTTEGNSAVVRNQFLFLHFPTI